MKPYLLILDNLITEDKTEPMIIVMVNGNEGYRGIQGFGQNALKAFENELKGSAIPLVEKKIHVKTDAANRALAGLSMGGLQTLYASVCNTDIFFHLGVFSSSWWANQPDFSNPEYRYMEENAAMINKNIGTFWISMGWEEDIAYAKNKVMMKKIDQLSVIYTASTMVDTPGRYGGMICSASLSCCLNKAG